jgi:hypothetical protein
MNQEKLNEIKKREEAATPGPWGVAKYSWSVVDHRNVIVSQVFGTSLSRRSADEEFIAHAREDIPELVAEVERLRAGLEEIVNHPAKTLRVNSENYSTDVWVARYASASELQDIARRVLDEGETK